MHESVAEPCGRTAAIHHTVSSSKTCFAETKLFNGSILLLRSLCRHQTEKCVLFVQTMQESLKVPAEESSCYWLTAQSPPFFLNRENVVSSQPVPTLLQAHYCYTYGRNAP